MLFLGVPVFFFFVDGAAEATGGGGDWRGVVAPVPVFDTFLAA